MAPLKILSGTLASALALSAASAHAGEPAPVIEYHPEEAPPPSTRYMVLGIGVLASAATYGAAVGASYAFDTDPYASDLRIPLVGPWIKLGHTRLCPSSTESNLSCSDANQVMGAILVTLDGILQAGSLGILIEGIFLSTKGKSVSQSVRRTAPLHQLRLGEFAFTPSFSAVPGAESSFGFVGTF